MFRRGGTVNDGIMTGLTDRKQYSIGGIDREQLGKESQIISDVLEEFAPIPKTRLPLGQFGLNLASGKFAGDGAIQNIVGSAQGPYAQFTKADDARQAAVTKRRAGAVSTALGSQMSEQKFKMQQMLKDTRIGLEKKVAYVKQIMGFQTDKEALEYINTSLSDISKLTPETRIQSAMKGQAVPNRSKAIYQVALQPHIPIAKQGGFITTQKNKFPKTANKGSTYFDISTGVLYEFQGGDPKDISSYIDVTAKYNKENIKF